MLLLKDLGLPCSLEYLGWCIGSGIEARTSLVTQTGVILEVSKLKTFLRLLHTSALS